MMTATYTETLIDLDRRTGYTQHARPNARGRKQALRNLNEQLTINVVWTEGKTNVRHEEQLGDVIFCLAFDDGMRIANDRIDNFNWKIESTNCRRKYKHVINSITIVWYDKNRKTSTITIQ